MKTIKFFLYFLVMSMTFTLVTSCGEEEEKLPPIGGFNNADEVGSASLLAYWPLNGDGKESKTGTAPSKTVGVTYGTGIKGQGAKFAEGYLAFPAIPALNSMSDVTISCWAKLNNNGSAPSVMFQMTRPLDASKDEWAGNITLMAETGWKKATSDTVTLKGLVVIKKDDGGQNWQDVINAVNPSAADIANGHVAAPNKIAGKYAHIVYTWESVTGKHRLFVNGVKISNPVWESRNGGNPLALNFFSPTKPLLGTFGSVITGNADSWQKSLTGELDEVRVWKKVLTDADINSLYELEKAGR
jgi:hypothetical protein